MRPLLSKCDTCKEPKPGTEYRRDEDGVRHGSCIACEGKRREKRLARMREYNKVYYDKYIRKTPRVRETTIQTRWKV